MRPTFPALRCHDLLIQRAAAAIAGMLVLGQAVALPAVTSAHPPSLSALPALPASWQPVPGSRIVTAAQRFVAYTGHGGVEVRLHSVTGLGEAAAAAPIARLTLGRHRVTVHPAGRGFEACWDTGEAWHRLSAAPVGLGDFMSLLLSLDWR